MTEAQAKWLQDNPNYSPVRNYPVVSFTQWTDQGYLWPNGQFSVDDGKTLFWNTRKAVRVGRHYEVV